MNSGRSWPVAWLKEYKFYIELQGWWNSQGDRRAITSNFHGDYGIKYVFSLKTRLVFVGRSLPEKDE